MYPRTVTADRRLEEPYSSERFAALRVAGASPREPSAEGALAEPVASSTTVTEYRTPKPEKKYSTFRCARFGGNSRLAGAHAAGFFLVRRRSPAQTRLQPARRLQKLLRKLEEATATGAFSYPVARSYHELRQSSQFLHPASARSLQKLSMVVPRSLQLSSSKYNPENPTASRFRNRNQLRLL